MQRKGGLSRRITALLAAAVFAVLSLAGVHGATHASADATTQLCTPDPSLDALDPCRADINTPGDGDPNYSYADAIVSHVEIPVPQTTVDALSSVSNIDYVWVDYIRPKVSDTVPVPTIMDESPYYNTLGRGYDSILKTPTDPNAPEAPVSVERCSTCPEAPFPEWEAHYFVPRGYAVALMDLRGTRNSSGCEVYGDKQEALDGVAVVDWIASQPWSNQHVGMIGGSYDGTMANGVAALYPTYGHYHNVDGHGTDALAAVVPIRAIDRWYDYQFFNGVEANGQELDPELFTAELPEEDFPTNGDPLMGPGSDPSYTQTLAQRKTCPAFEQVATDEGYTAPYQDTQDAATTAFWTSRDYLQYASTWKAATLFIHGLFDNNVKTMNSGQLWDALTSRGSNAPPLRYVWFNGGHADPDTPSVAVENANGLTSEYLMPYTWMQKFEHEVHQWFLQFLKGVPDGALDAPKVEIQRDYDDPGDTLQQGHWDSYDQYPADPTYADDSILHFNSSTLTADATTAPAGSVQWDDEPTGQFAPQSESFVTAPFATDTRISGQFEFNLTISADGEDTTVAAEVDDVPPGALSDPNFASEAQDSNTDPFAFTYGYIRAYYRASINPRGVSYPTAGSFLTPNTQYTLNFPSTYTDYVVRAGHRLRFTFSDESAYSLATYQGNVVTMYTGGTGGLSQVHVPEVPYIPTPPPASVPDLSTGILGVGGPVTGVLLAASATVAVRRRRRR